MHVLATLEVHDGTCSAVCVNQPRTCGSSFWAMERLYTSTEDGWVLQGCKNVVLTLHQLWGDLLTCGVLSILLYLLCRRRCLTGMGDAICFSSTVVRHAQMELGCRVANCPRTYLADSLTAA